MQKPDIPLRTARLSHRMADPESEPAVHSSPGSAARAVLAAAAALMMLELISAPAMALSCRKVAQEQSLSMLDEAVLVLRGEIVSVSAGPDGSTMAAARVLQLYKGSPQEDVVAFGTPLPIRTPDGPWIGLEIGIGERGLLVLKQSGSGLVQTNIACDIPWQEHLEQLRGQKPG